MSWAKVKKINSDMTKPIDKLLEEYYKEYENSQIYVASDNVLVSGTTISNVSHSGALRLRIIGSYSGVSMKIGNLNYLVAPITRNTPMQDYVFDFGVGKGDTVSFTVTGSATCYICGSLISSPLGTF